MWNRDSPVCVSVLHFLPWRDWSLWPHLRWASSRTVTRPSLTQLFCPSFTLTAGPPSRFTTDIVGCWGSPVKSLQSYSIHTQFHWFSGSTLCFPWWETQVQSPGGGLMWNRDSPVSVVSLQDSKTELLLVIFFSLFQQEELEVIPDLVMAGSFMHIGGLVQRRIRYAENRQNIVVTGSFEMC